MPLKILPMGRPVSMQKMNFNAIFREYAKIRWAIFQNMCMGGKRCKLGFPPVDINGKTCSSMQCALKLCPNCVDKWNHLVPDREMICSEQISYTVFGFSFKNAVIMVIWTCKLKGKSIYAEHGRLWHMTRK
jgi:hypothetical protein